MKKFYVLGTRIGIVPSLLLYLNYTNIQRTFNNVIFSYLLHSCNCFFIHHIDKFLLCFVIACVS